MKFLSFEIAVENFRLFKNEEECVQFEECIDPNLSIRHRSK